MKYIICTPSGQLGNQIYITLFLNKISAGKSKILVLGCSQLTNLFLINIPNIKFLTMKFKGGWRIPSILTFLANKNIIGSIDQNRQEYINKTQDYGIGHTTKKGFFDIYYVRSGFFLSDSFFNYQDIKLLKIRDEFLQSAQIQIGKIPSDKTPVFVHVRRGDYLNFSFNGLPAGAGVLPISYYHKAFTAVAKQIQKPFFIFLSDDTSYVNEVFHTIQDKIISNSSFEVDFAIMTLCKAGVIANSTFSIWGAYFAQKNCNAMIYAPFNNLGYSHNIEIPSGVMASNFNYIKTDSTCT